MQFDRYVRNHHDYCGGVTLSLCKCEYIIYAPYACCTFLHMLWCRVKEDDAHIIKLNDSLQTIQFVKVQWYVIPVKNKEKAVIILLFAHRHGTMYFCTTHKYYTLNERKTEKLNKMKWIETAQIRITLMLPSLSLSFVQIADTHFRWKFTSIFMFAVNIVNLFEHQTAVAAAELLFHEASMIFAVGLIIHNL